MTTLSDRAVRVCVGTGVALMLLAVAAITVPDPDLWGHVRFGLDMLGTRQLPAIDPYSFTQDVPWINHEWLSELQMGAAYALAGSTGLALLKAVWLAITAWLAWTAWRGIDLTARILMGGVVALAIAPAALTLRPQVWSMLAIAVLCRLLGAGQWRPLAWLPVLFMLWANLHGGFVVGLGILGAWAVGGVIEAPRTARRWALVVAGATLATLVTPYGVTLWRFLFETVELGRPHIEEWQPVWTRPALLGVWLLATLAAVWSMQRLKAGRVGVALVTAMLAFAAFRVIRLVPLYVETLAVLLVPAIAARWPAGPRRARRFDRAEQATAVVILLVGVSVLTMVVPARMQCLPVEDTWSPPSRVVRQMLASAPPGRLASFFNWGEYALWHLSPGIRVSMDGRRETVYSERRLAEHGAILAGHADGFAVLASWQAEYVWLPASSGRTRDWLVTHGYRLDWDDAESFLAVRADLPRLAPPVLQPVRRCFPD